MNRRRFLATLFLGAPAAAVAQKMGLWEKLKTWAATPRIHPFTLDADGVLSLRGQRQFVVFNRNGGLSGGYAQYRLQHGRIVAEYHTYREAPQYFSILDGGDLGRGTSVESERIEKLSFTGRMISMEMPSGY